MVEENGNIPLLTDIVAPDIKLQTDSELITMARLLGDLEAIVQQLSDAVANRLRHNIEEEIRAELARILTDLLEKKSRETSAPRDDTSPP